MTLTQYYWLFTIATLAGFRKLPVRDKWRAGDHLEKNMRNGKIYGNPTFKMVLIATFSAWIGINGLLGLTILLG